MSELTFERVVQQVRQLPSLSAVLHEILLSFDNEDIESAALVNKISCDQGLAARVLRVANSAFYGLSSHVTSIDDAVVVLGFHCVRSLAVAAGIIEQFPLADGKSFSRLEFWHHATGVGVCARVIAMRVGLNAETAFTAGLLHDVGRLALDVYFHDEFEQVLTYCAKQDGEMLEAEWETLGMTHASIGFEMAKQWKFPLPIQLAIRDHHHPDSGQHALLTDTVHCANVLCHALEIGNSGYDMVPPLSAGAWERLGLGWKACRAILPEIERQNAALGLLMESN